jgi:hypothetical protein
MLGDDAVRVPHPKRLSPSHPRFGEIMSRHDAAVACGVATYRDPTSGLAVFTAQFLAERDRCCDSGCRHCPHVVD